MRLVLGDDQLQDHLHEQRAGRGEEELTVDYKGDALDIGFNITYLLDVLRTSRSTACDVRVRRRQLERARHDAGARRLQVRRHADAHLSHGSASRCAARMVDAELKAPTLP